MIYGSCVHRLTDLAIYLQFARIVSCFGYILHAWFVEVSVHLAIYFQLANYSLRSDLLVVVLVLNLVLLLFLISYIKEVCCQQPTRVLPVHIWWWLLLLLLHVQIYWWFLLPSIDLYILPLLKVHAFILEEPDFSFDCIHH